MIYSHHICGILLKNCHMAPSPLATQTAPLVTRGIAYSTRTEIIAHSTRTEIITHSIGMSHIRKYARPTFYLIRMSHSRHSVRSTSHFLWIFHIRPLPPDGRSGRFDFPRQTCPDPSATLIRITSVANDSDSPDSLARQILAIRRIHFHPQSKR